MTMTLTQKLTIMMAEVEDLDRLAPLFDAYRVFYGRPGNLPASSHFLFERMINHDSVIYLAQEGDGPDAKALGFLQLYPSFSSVALAPVWILNDLYVIPEVRGQGVAKALIQQAMQLVIERGDHALVLETAHDNRPARQLYEGLGFKEDRQFAHYMWHPRHND